MVYTKQREPKLGSSHHNPGRKNQELAFEWLGQHKNKMRLPGMLAIGATMKVNIRKRHTTNEGFSLIELMFAMLVLTFGVLATMTMVIMGVSRNGSNRFDTTATNVAQTVLEEIAGTAPNTNPVLTVTDCTGANLSISTTPGGANVVANGAVDFTQSAATLNANNYQMNYTVCGTNGQRVAYDVRWRVQSVGVYGKLVTVSAQQQFVNSTRGIAFLPPVTLRTVVGM